LTLLPEIKSKATMNIKKKKTKKKGESEKDPNDVEDKLITIQFINIEIFLSSDLKVVKFLEDAIACAFF
jgi:hypothetical protein